MAFEEAYDTVAFESSNFSENKDLKSYFHVAVNP